MSPVPVSLSCPCICNLQWHVSKHITRHKTYRFFLWLSLLGTNLPEFCTTYQYYKDTTNFKFFAASGHSSTLLGHCKHALRYDNITILLQSSIFYTQDINIRLYQVNICEFFIFYFWERHLLLFLLYANPLY